MKRILICVYIVRGIDVTVVATTYWPNLKLGEAMFELPWIFGFAAIALYACSILVMLADVNPQKTFRWYREPKTIYFICYGYLILVFVVTMTLAIVAGKFGDETVDYLTKSILSTDPIEKLKYYGEFLNEQNTYMILTLVHYVIWACQCFLLMIFTLIFVTMFVVSTNKRIANLKVNHPKIKTFMFKVNIPIWLRKGRLSSFENF
jgi:hypothetical protein